MAKKQFVDDFEDEQQDEQQEQTKAPVATNVKLNGDELFDFRHNASGVVHTVDVKQAAIFMRRKSDLTLVKGDPNAIHSHIHNRGKKQ